jgi:hypothetical protein
MPHQNYPEPEELKAFAANPLPFHSLKPSDLALKQDGGLWAGCSPVYYVYGASYINLETAEGEWHRESDTDYYDLSFSQAWKEADNVVVEDDYVTASGLAPGRVDDPARYEAYWTLGTIKIRS